MERATGFEPATTSFAACAPKSGSGVGASNDFLGFDSFSQNFRR